MITIFFLRDAELYQFDEAKSIEDIINNPAFEQMNYFLEWMVNSFIVKVSMMNKKHIDWRQHQFPLSKDHFPTQGIIACSANDQEQTYSLLAKDKKFMQKLRDIEEEFRNGFERLVNLG